MDDGACRVTATWPPSWAQVGNQWRYVPSRWDRNGDGVPDRYQAERPYGDRDRDGIPNRYDRYDNRQGAFGDRDRDGVPNAFDNWDNRRR